VATTLTTGRAMTALDTESQKPPVFVARRPRRPMNGIVSQLTRSPMRPSTAGNSVVEASTAAATTRIAPTAKLLKVPSA